MPASAYLQAADLKAMDFQGKISEDVMNQIWDISPIPLPFTDAVGSDTASNPYTEWTTDKLGDPAVGGWVVDGADSDQNDSALGKRIGNHCGILTKEVQVSHRARSVDTIGTGDELAYQVMMRQQELRRNVEANALGIQGSTVATTTVAGVPAGLACMVTKHDAQGTGGVFLNGNWSAYAPAVARGLTETLVRDACQAAWEDGADPSLLMSVPSVIRGLSEYMFTASARIATLQRDNQGDMAQALGTVNVFITDFGVTLEFVPNRLQQVYDDATPTTPLSAASVFILDPSYARLSFLEGYRVDPLAKAGLSEKRLMSVDFTVKVLNPDAHRVIPDIDPAVAVVK